MITPSIAVNTIIKPSLVKDFGIAIATIIILQNSQKCSVTVANLDREGYIGLIELIACDYRVTKTYDKDNITQRKREWLAEFE